MKITQFLHSLVCRNKSMAVLAVILTILSFVMVIRVMNIDFNNTLKEKLIVLSSSPVIYSTSELLCIDNTVISHNQGEMNVAKYNLLVYSGPDECSTCAMSKMSEWNAMLDFEKEGLIKMTFIFCPSEKEKGDLIAAYRSSGLEHSILIDTCGIFPRQNPHIPQESRFHTFLLDSVGKVVLVGNPIKNMRIKKLYYEIITGI